MLTLNSTGAVSPSDENVQSLLAKAAGGYVSLLVPGSEVSMPLVVKGAGKLSWKAELFGTT